MRGVLSRNAGRLQARRFSSHTSTAAPARRGFEVAHSGRRPVGRARRGSAVAGASAGTDAI